MLSPLLLLSALIGDARATTECSNVDLTDPQYPAGLLVSAGGASVTATFCDGESAYTSDTYLASPDVVYIGTGHITPAGNVVDLGVHTFGEELVFSIYVRNTGYTYYSGPGSRNPDGQVHAAITDLGDGTYIVGFEDLYGGGDRDYDDINLIVEAEAFVFCDDLDADGVCDDIDLCGGVEDADNSDTDGDGVGDACDACPLDNPDDTDLDGSCDNDDICPGYDDAADADGDGEPDGCDECPNDAANDADDDGVCGDVDVCPGYDDTVDSDGDGTPDGCDSCPNSATGDSDSDGVCDDLDLCPGYDDTADRDADGTPDDCDICPDDAADDADADGICGDVDACAGTDIVDAPTRGLKVNHWADLDGDGNFDTVLPRGKGPTRAYTIEDTEGCSCTQIIEACDYGSGHTYHGCSISVMDAWVAGGCH